MRNTLAESSEWKQYMLDVRKKVVWEDGVEVSR